MALRFELINPTQIPLEVEGILPTITVGKPLGEIEKLSIFHGNRPVALADFFRVSGSPDDGCMHWVGDLSGVHWIGAGMVQGTIRIEGSAGRHVGSRMRGGRLEVSGDVSDWLGGEMLGGEIVVRGRAGHLVGSAYRGSARGMTGGTLLVHGDVGNEIGHGMRRGLMAIAGSAGDLIGFNMLAGSIFVFGNSGIRHGAGMRRGTIGLFGPEPLSLLPSFRRACQGQFEFLRLVDRTLQRHGFPAPLALRDTTVVLHHGDLLDGGRGELLLRADAKA
jgi:formylmethanofuran dehydrogenase subunit C